MNSRWSQLRGWKLYLFLYMILLLASHLVIWQFESPIQLEDDKGRHKITLQAVPDKGKRTDREVQVTYEDIRAASEGDKPVIVLLPGGPEGTDVFDRLTPKLKEHFRIIIPHLPGYGSPKKELPNYSFRSLSIYADQLVDKLDISKIHIVGYGLGGASAIHWAQRDSGQVASLTLLSSIGVQELELLGSYTLNHAVHGLQLGAVWLAHHAIPHFGLFDALGVSVPYAKSYYESDQRPLRSYLKSYRGPMLILHGKEDPLVPIAVAQEHHRIVPQSKMRLYQADHDLVETHADSLSDAITSFVREVEEGKALVAADASPHRLAEADKPFSNVDFAQFEGVSLLILMLIIIFATLISEDLTCIGAGLLAARGLIGFWPASLACLLGIFIGDIGLYLVGRFIGRKAVRKAPFKWILSQRDLDKSAEWFDRKGPMIIIASRFLPGSRLPTYFSAGVIGAGFWMFSFYFLVAAVIWTPLLVGISKILGNELLRYFSLYQEYAIWVFLGLVLLLIVIAKAIIPAFSYRGRRLLVSRYRRLVHWQYWPPFILYLPVACYIVYLGLKNRCMTLFALANPGLPDGGFVGESKSDILSRFPSKDVAVFKKLSGSLSCRETLDEVGAFMEDRDLSFPIVLKPDVGQRGKGVQIIQDKDELKKYLEEAKGDLIIQKYIDGQEYGVFYYRYPHKEKGKLWSITVKKLICVEGDGRKTVEELILSDDQAVTLAKLHLKEKEEQLYEVPEEGASVPIVELGTHARGAIFEEGASLKTEMLTRKMNEICNPVSGFYFGRLDIKVPDTESLRRGKEIKVIEVNGVTSESTNIYDNKYNYFKGLGILCRQWKLAFAIGKQNLSKEAEAPSTINFLVRTFWTLMKQQEE